MISSKSIAAAALIAFLGMRRALENKWRGSAVYLGELVKGTRTVLDADSTTINGCQCARCQKFELGRV